MTNAETLLIVLITLGGVCGPLAILVFVAFRQSSEVYTVLKETHSYTTPWSRVFLSVDVIGALLFLFMSGIFFSLLMSWLFNPPKTHPSGYLVLFVAGTLFAALAIHILTVYLNHWKHLKYLRITFEPATKRILIEKDGAHFILTEGAIEKVEMYSTGSRISMEYYKLILVDGSHIFLPGTAKGVAAIFEYFKKIPQSNVRQWRPIIPDNRYSA